MDTSWQLFHVSVSLAIFVLSLFFFPKPLFPCLILLINAFQNLERIWSKGPAPDSSPGNINNEMKKIEEESSSLDFASSDYEVFLSFRGLDTRNNFVSYLYKELNAKGIHTFKDDKEIQRGNSISPSLLEAIEKSRIAVVVLSQNYAFSSWCLDELVKIFECQRVKKLTVLPIFYKVDPSDVEEQKGTLSKAFEEHQQNFDEQKVKMWRNALTEVATIAGWESNKCFDGNEAALIECIARDILDKLICTASSYAASFVGIDAHLLKIDKLLDFECNDVRMVGIWGIGGIGKTTIADFIFHRDGGKFEASCCLKNIKDKYKKDGVITLQKEFISQVLSERNLNIWNVDVGCNVIHKRLRRKRVLIMLDDIDELEQLEVLANDIQWFGEGSRIVVTTRDKRLLIVHGIEHIYEVPTLNEDQALQLFCLNAFKENQPPTHFSELSRNFVSYAKGLPLALKILGNSLYKRDVEFWQSEFEKLKRIPNPNIYRVLKVSYDTLDDSDKKVFLDIAFFFNGKSKDAVRAILWQCDDFYPERAFTILEEKALLTISSYNELCMHDMILEMGREIVREESDDPSKRSRLYHSNDVYKVLKHGKETTTEGISLNITKIKPICLKPNTFTGMKNLRILNFYKPYYGGNKPQVHLLEDLNFLPDELRYLNWDFFPAKYLPSTFFGENLVELQLQKSNLEHLWTEKLELGNLQVINLSGSKYLKDLPDLSKATNIKSIDLDDCQSLVEFSCDLTNLQKLHTLGLSYCKKLDKLPRLPSMNLNMLYLCKTGIKELPLEIQFLTELQILDLSKTNIKELPSEIQSLTKLIELNLFGCKKLTTLPIEIGSLKSLFSLKLEGAVLKELPQSIGELKSLNYLRLGESDFVFSSPDIWSYPRPATFGEQGILKIPETIGKLKSLVELVLTCCSIAELPESIEHLHKLQELQLYSCPNLVRLPSCMHKLFSLKKMEIMQCKSLCSLPELPQSLFRLAVDDCESLETIPSDDWGHLEGLEIMILANCNKLDRKACSEILESAKLKILHSCVINDGHRLDYVVPGSKIPNWFHYKSCESSVTIKLPSLLHQIKGIAFCVVFENNYLFHPTTPANIFTTTCVAKADCLDLELMDWEQVIRGSDHVMVHLASFCDESVGIFTEYLGCDVQFNFSIYIDGFIWNETHTELKVKKCGAYVISDEEVPASMPNSFDRGFGEGDSSEEESFTDEENLLE